jgi:NitT/TauT family transport system substrate-binding protein
MKMRVGILAALVSIATALGASAEPVKIGLQKIAALGPIFVAVDKGYFAAAGLTPQLVYFDASQPIAVAVMSGDIDVGITGLTAGFYNLAGKGAMRILASETQEMPSFRGGVIVASNRAYDAGLKSFTDLKSHSVAITQVGSAIHYSLSLILAKYQIPLTSVKILPLQTNSNSVSAVVGGQADAVLTPVTYVLPALQRGDVKMLGYVGDEVSWQLGAVFVSGKVADERQDFVKRFLGAYRQGTRDYHDAFVGPDERRRDGPDAPALLAIIAKSVGGTPANVGGSIAYVDADGRLDEQDIARQVEWYKSQHMVNADVNTAAMIDNRYARPLPEADKGR